MILQKESPKLNTIVSAHQSKLKYAINLEYSVELRLVTASLYSSPISLGECS